jgi:hypothetical protein
MVLAPWLHGWWKGARRCDMLRSVAQHIGYRLEAADGRVGRVRDVLFDDRRWQIRYLVTSTGPWILGRQVLVPGVVLGVSNPVSRTIAVGMTRTEIHGAPLAEDRRGGSGLHSLRRVTGYRVRAVDGDAGILDDLIMDDESWELKLAVVDARTWLAGSRVVVRMPRIEYIDRESRRIGLSLDRDAIRRRPPYDPAAPVNRATDGGCRYDYLGRPHCS